MPTRFNQYIGDQQLSGNTKAVISFDALNNMQSKAQKALSVIEDARKVIPLTIAALNNGTAPRQTQYALEQFFRTEQCYQGAAIKYVVAKLQLILNGITGNVRLKIGNLQDANGSQFSGGYVNQKDDMCSKWYHTDPKNDFDRYGAIHLSNNSITLRTFVHEAAHKYCGSEDHFYLSPVDTNVKPIIFQIDPQTTYDANDTTQPIFNADSYGWIIAYFSMVF